jgi:DNA repair exonuclease SbcCD ATPase subunit
MQAKNDSLALAAIRANTEFEQIMGLLNEVEANFQSIKSAENFLTLQSSSPGETTPSIQERIQNNIQLITETLDKNRRQIADLEDKMEKSTLNSTQLNKMLANLRKELDDKTKRIATLQEELEKRDRQIAVLTDNVTVLSKDVKTLTDQSIASQQVIERQQIELNTAYFFYGTARELKRKNIVLRGQVSPNILPGSFAVIDDLNTQTVIPLDAKQGKLISKHPAGSYEFKKGVNGKVELYILEPRVFWSLTKYLVIEVKV